uniref:C-type lectin domain-containing protein n=1 Tax=Panagrolaimus davidi TaxID=227884 RepID=A0A914QB73_9BILA
MKLNGHLVSIHDGFTNAFIDQTATKNIKTTDFWIGATKNGNQTWQWTDGSNLDFIDWKNDQSNNSNGKNCAAFAISDGYWSAQDCSNKKPFACATLDATDQTPTTPTPPSPCENGWKYFGPAKACYLLFNQTEVETEQPAEDICVQNGAHLSSLHSHEEAMFLLNFEDQLGYALWIGLITNDKGMTWKWTDGSPTDYMPWRSGFPYPYFDYDTCGLLMTDNGNPVYENLECSFSQPFMCKKLL